MLKKIIAVLLSLVMLLPLMALAEGEVTLKVLWFNDANESEVFEETIKGYLEENPNVKVDMQVIAFDAYEKQLKLMLAGGNAPDLVRLPTALMPVFSEHLALLEDYADVKAIEEAFAPAMLAYAKNTEGKLVAYPTEATANGMLINKTAFDKAGVDLTEISKTWDWQEWAELIKKVVEANDNIKYGLAVDFTPHRLSTILYQFNGRMLSEDLSKVNFSNEGTINALKWFKQMHDDALVPPSVWMGSENPAELFQAGLVACHIGGSWNINTYAKIEDFEWTAVQMPKGTMRSSVPGGKFIAGFKDSANQAEAQKLMAYFSDAEHNAQYCLGTYNLSSRTDVSIEYPSATEAFNVFSEELKVTPEYTAQEWNTSLVGKISGIVKEQVVQALLGTMTVEEVCAEIDKQAADLQ
ncbi:MAG: sugar ABC transporter substrate-binding protein [Eubacteriales bacterium]|nr:sugar ABC transporter substrate-binding protein [Eubacteriales bacterium]